MPLRYIGRMQLKCCLSSRYRGVCGSRNMGMQKMEKSADTGTALHLKMELKSKVWRIQELTLSSAWQMVPFPADEAV
jgi:hypothetical protein